MQWKYRISALPSTGLAFQIQSTLHPNYCYCFATLRKKDSFHLAFVSIFALTVRGKALPKLIVWRLAPLSLWYIHTFTTNEKAHRIPADTSRAS